MAGSSYIEYRFTANPPVPAIEILIAELAGLGFEGFEETQEGLLAYIRQPDHHEGMLEGVGILYDKNSHIEYRTRVVEARNWNQRWESRFKPVFLAGQCVIRAPFHPASGVAYDIVIEPKMSFGTGHHETTQMMVEFLMEEDLEGMSVLDMGCGTGVLAILAGMKGAAAVDALDTDPWAYENARENTLRNNQRHIRVELGDAELLKGRKYDLIMANINRNILLADLPAYAAGLKPAGVLLLSGFYFEDLNAISQKCGDFNLKFEKNKAKGNWVASKYVF